MGRGTGTQVWVQAQAQERVGVEAGVGTDPLLLIARKGKDAGQVVVVLRRVRFKWD